MVGTRDNRNVLKLRGQIPLSLSLSLDRHDQTPDFLLGVADIVSIKALSGAWQKFSRGKKARNDVADYQKNLCANLATLHSLLADGRYTHHAYQRFTIHDPKQRQIHKAIVADRIVHQAIVSAIEPLFEKQFIYDSYSCRVNKGTHAGVLRLRAFLRKASHNNTQKAYVLKCDIRKYFASIDHEILLGLIARRIKNEEILELIRTIILSHGSETGKGIPLGNITSQLFANIYLHELDWFMKQTLGVQHYIRYCDDFVVVSTDRVYLEQLIHVIRQFLQLNLRLGLHPNKIEIRLWSQGVDFLGYVQQPHAITIRPKTRKRMLAKVTAENASSYLGICTHATAHELSNLLKTLAWERSE